MAPATVEAELASPDVFQGTGVRVGGLDADRLAALAAEVDTWPPVVAYRPDLTVIDGAHRVEAARRLGIGQVAVRWFEGTRAEALIASVTLNDEAGTPVGATDREAVLVELMSELPQWSDRRIAAAVGSSPKTVARLRRRAACTGETESKRVGRDGRLRPVRSGSTHEAIADALHRRPHASLRAIAAEIGVSPETVRSVRHRLNGTAAASVASATTPSPLAAPIPDPLRGVETGLAEVDEADESDADEFDTGEGTVAPWRRDRALESAEHGDDFLGWFETTTVEGDHRTRGLDVPMSRVYEIADEARRRAQWWLSFATTLEQRSRRS